jgi:hypothetical protein
LIERRPFQSLRVRCKKDCLDSYSSLIKVLFLYYPPVI